MTEAEWIDCVVPQLMLPKLCGMSDRKMRLFACACCRQDTHAWAHPGVRQIVELAERCCDGLAPLDDLVPVRIELSQTANNLRPGLSQTEERYRSWESKYDCYDWAQDRGDELNEEVGRAQNLWQQAMAGRAVGLPAAADAVRAILDHTIGKNGNPSTQCALLRDIAGNPFRSIPLDTAWRTATVTGLAQTIYDDRAFDRHPILADALEDAGCTNTDILQHCRQPGEHARGCWVVDLVLGKE